MEKVFREDGLQGFYLGISAKLSQTVINSALMLSFYESIFKFFVVALTKLLAWLKVTKL
jgi:hypothetical protein